MDILTKYSPADTSGCTVLWSDKISKFCVVHLCTNTHSMITYHDMHMQCIFARTCIRITHALSACGTLATAWLQFVSWTNSDVTCLVRAPDMFRCCDCAFAEWASPWHEDRSASWSFMSAPCLLHMSPTWVPSGWAWAAFEWHDVRATSKNHLPPLRSYQSVLVLSHFAEVHHSQNMSGCQNVRMSVFPQFPWFSFGFPRTFGWTLQLYLRTAEVSVHDSWPLTRHGVSGHCAKAREIISSGVVSGNSCSSLEIRKPPMSLWIKSETWKLHGKYIWINTYE